MAYPTGGMFNLIESLRRALRRSTMPFILGGIAIAGAVMGGMQQSQQAAQQRAQQAHQEFQRKIETQRKNRAIAKQNALRWQQNKFIAEAANSARAERDYYLRLNYNNETGEFSRNMSSTNSRMLGYLNGKNIKGQTAKQLMRQSLESAKNAQVSRRLSQENRLIASERQQQRDLSQRDFSYNDAISYMPNPPMPDQTGAIMGMAITQGILSGAAAAYGASQQQAFQGERLDAINRQNELMTQALVNQGQYVPGAGPRIG